MHNLMVTFLNLKSLFAFHIILQVPFLEVGQVWATAGFYRVVTCWWDVGGFLLVACVRCVAAVPFWVGARNRLPPLSGPVTGPTSSGKWQRQIKFLFQIISNCS